MEELNKIINHRRWFLFIIGVLLLFAESKEILSIDTLNICFVIIIAVYFIFDIIESAIDQIMVAITFMPLMTKKYDTVNELFDDVKNNKE